MRSFGLVLALSLISTVAIASANLDGFRGIKWGDPPAKLGPHKPSIAKGGKQCFERVGEKLQLGDAQLHKVLYCFRENRFDYVIADSDRRNSKALKKVALQAFGTPSLDISSYAHWSLPGGVDIGWFGKTGKAGEFSVLLLSSSTIDKEIDARKKEEKRQAARKDF